MTSTRLKRGEDSLGPVSEPTGVPRRTLGAGATLASLAQIGAALTGGLMGVVIARVLGPSGTGHVNLVLTAGLVLASICSLGVEVGLNYHVSGRRWPAPAALRPSGLGVSSTVTT